ncbi:unnamed protein product [Clonostachys rhizophaga]|uniref:Heterokaryon incompatibility domain-containing protein n=1 Tax=Clonostachys rhizophaga TaxID=160324 RepID=A0A9N9VY29_9HYPO|nr:unnamed protein product [Clonostachys rhizophaga]
MGAFFSKIWSVVSRCVARSPFAYPDALGRDSIRLVQFIKPKWYTFGLQSPRLVLSAYPIHDLPKFVALSYTWGHPHNQSPGVIKAYQQHFPIYVNNQQFHVLRNLKEALSSLLWFWEFNDDVQHLWIDAICINQDDIAERAAQVSIMDQIFMRAQTTAVWLGQSNPGSWETLGFFDKMLKVPAADLMPYYKHFPNGSPPPPEFWESHGLPRIDDAKAWKPLTQFFEHRWFNRVWIIQEVTLSTKKVVLFWGHNALPWVDLGHISFVGQVAKVGKLNSITAAGHGDLLNQEESLERDWAVSDPFTNAFQLYHSRQRYLERSLGTADDTLLNEMKSLTGAKFPSASSWLLYFCMVNRWTDASDPRDKVFGQLGLVNHIVEQDGLEPNEIQAEYSSHVTPYQVYQRLMSKVTEETDSLAVLMALNDPLQDGNYHLPSWVPNFSRRRGLDLMALIRPQFDVCKSSSNSNQSERRKLKVSGPTLYVETIKIGHVKTLSASLADLIGPRWYSWTQDLLLLDPIYSWTGESRVEAFWRTLLMNSVGRNYPAQWPDSKNGDMFRAYILQNIAQHFPGGGDALDKYLQDLQGINELAKSDSSGHMPSFTGLENLTTQILNTDLNHPQAFTEELMANKLTEYRDNASRFLMGMDGSMLNRRIAMGTKGHICNVPMQVERSDMIAIVNGCPCPLILRPRGDTYTLVGTAYVHGIMYGEAMDGAINWEEICIV